MNAKKLLESLKAQEQNLDQLLTVIEEQKRAIVQNNIAALEKAIADEQRILLLVERQEQERAKYVVEIANFYKLELKENKLDELLEKGKNYFGKDIKELRKVRLSLKDKLNNVLNTNTVLKDVVNFSRNMIKETMILLGGTNNQIFVNKKV